MGIPVAMLAIAATMLGTERVKALRCHVTQCSATDRASRLCRLIAETEDVPIEQQPAARQRALQGTWPTAEMSEFLSQFAAAPMGGAYDVIMDALQADGQGEFFCPAFTRNFAGPVAVTPKRIIVQGRTLVRLQQGTIPAASLGLNLLEIEGLDRALGYTRDGTALQVNAPDNLPVQLLYQLAYSLGRAGVPQLNFVFQGLVQRTMQIDLPAYGTCPECLLDLPEVGSQKKALTVIGRHDGPGTEYTTPPTLLVLPKEGPHFTKEGPKPTQRDVLAVLAAPNRAMKDLVRAVRALRGPTAAPRYGKVVLTVLADRSIPSDASALLSPQLATHTALKALSAKAKKPTTRTAARRRSTSKSTSQKGWAPTPLPASGEAIAASIVPKLRSVKDCYEQALRHQSRLAGKVTLHFDIDANGRTQRVRLEDHTLGSKQVTGCIARRARQWRLPVPQDAPVSVAYPLVFSPTGV